MTDLRFPGVIPAVQTPFGPDGSIDHEALAANVRRMLEAGIDGFVGCGTMGEAQSLSRDERRSVIATIVEAAEGRVGVTAGISSETPERSAAYAADAAAAGATSVMALPSFGYGGDADEVVAWYAELDRLVDLPIMAYNNPKASGTDMDAALIVRIADEVPGVVAIKECSGDARRIPDIIHAVDGRLEVLVGGDDWALEGFAAGATGWISGVAVCAPEVCRALYEQVRDADLVAARESYARLLPLAHLDMTMKLVQHFKAAQDRLGYVGGPVRLPRLPLKPDELEVLEAAVARLQQEPAVVA